MDQDTLDATVAKLRQLGRDDAWVEVKASARSLSKDVWDSISAFANTSGGAVILGLSEESGFHPVVDFALDRVQDQLIDGLGDGNTSGGKLANPPTYHLSTLNVEGARVLVAEIGANPAQHKPCFVIAKGMTGGSFKRVADKDIRLSATEIFELQHVNSDHGADRATVDEARPEDLDTALVGQLLASRRSSRALKGVNDPTLSLTRLNVTDREGHVRLAGLITLGAYPQQFFPRLLVDVTVHPTSEKSPPGTQLRFLDRVECEGPLAEVVEHAVAAVAKNIRTYSVIEDAGRVDRLEIPRDVIREAVANAVLHREYHPLFQGQPVNVDIYPDRVTITNPGGLWGGKTVENLDDGVSRCRNQTLLQLLQHVPLTSGAGAVAEGQGSGVLFMINEMKAQALEGPSYRVTPDQVTVELRRHGLEIPEHRAWLRTAAPEGVTPHAQAALLMARRDGHVTVQRLQDALRIDSDLVRTVLRDLLAHNLLQLCGPEDYVLVDSAKNAVSRGADLDVLQVLSTSEPLGIHDISLATGKRVTAIRPVLRRLAQAGRVRATAPPSSKNRRYLRAE